MNITDTKIGYWMSIISLFLFFIYTACFIIILFVNEPFIWTNVRAFAAYEANSQSLYKYIGMGCMILYTCAFVVMVASIHSHIKAEKQFIYNITLIFSIAFCITVSIGYFVQLSATRLQLQDGLIDGLVQFTQSFSHSAINAINMLGWTLFYALASLFFSFLFNSSPHGRAARIACRLNAAMMFVGMVGYISDNYSVLLITMNFGLGATGIGLLITTALFYNSLSKGSFDF